MGVNIPQYEHHQILTAKKDLPQLRSCNGTNDVKDRLMIESDRAGGKMRPDMCVPCGDGLLNIRVGALIVKDGKMLMVQSSHDYLYSIGGRIKIGETAEEAVVREVFEETGVRMRIKRPIAVHENYFYGDMPTNQGKLIYEISFYFEMDVPDDFEPVCDSITEAGEKEFLRWVAPDTPTTIYPVFFRKEAVEPSDGIVFSLTDEREQP